MKEQFVQAVAPYLLTLAATVVTALLSAVTTALQKKIKSERASLILGRLDHLAEDAVLWGFQSFRSKGGSLKPLDAKEIREVVSNRIKNLLSPKGIREASAALGLDEDELDKLIQTKVEAWVADTKMQSGRAAVSVAQFNVAQTDPAKAREAVASTFVPPTPPSA